MAIDRRRFIGLGLAAAVLGPVEATANPSKTCWMGCRRTADDRHLLSGIDAAGRITFDIALPARGHGFAVDPASGLLAVFARRPGDFVWIIDTTSGELVLRIPAMQGRHFYGHGAFTPDGRLLCSENAYKSGDGVIGVYDMKRNGERSGELTSHGIGPHEILLHENGRTLIVANGGILTHPDLPRIKQNLDSMRPNLALMAIDDGRLLHRVEPPGEWHQVSIRHIAIGAVGTIAVAMQYEGHPLQRPPVIAIQNGDGPLKMLSAPGDVQRQLRNYCGSVAFDSSGDIFAVTSPRGGTVTYWRRNGEFIGSHAQADACGVAMTSAAGSFMVSDGSGGLALIDDCQVFHRLASHAESRWDNHLVAV